MSLRSFFVLLIAVVLTGILVYGLFLLPSTRPPSAIHFAFVERRNAIAELLRQLSAVQDTDLSSLSDVDRRRDWKEGLRLMTDVVSANTATTILVEALMSATRDLIAETQQISDPALRDQALAAMTHLSFGNEHMRSYFRFRSTLFLTLQQYYADRAVGKSLQAPTIADDFAAIDAAVSNASISYALFRDAIERFDRVARLRYQGALLFLS